MARLSQLAGNQRVILTPTVTIAFLLALFQQGLRMTRRFPASCDSHAIVVRYQHIFPVKYTAWSLKKVVARSVAVSWIIWVKSVLSSWNW